MEKERKNSFDFIIKLLVIIFIVSFILFYIGIGYFTPYSVVDEISDMKGIMYLEKEDLPLLKDYISYWLTFVSIVVSSTLTYFLLEVSKQSNEFSAKLSLKEEMEKLGALRYFESTLQFLKQRIEFSKERAIDYLSGTHTNGTWNESNLDFFLEGSEKIYLDMYHKTLNFSENIEFLNIYENVILIDKKMIKTLNESKEIQENLKVIKTHLLTDKSLAKSDKDTINEIQMPNFSFKLLKENRDEFTKAIELSLEKIRILKGFLACPKKIQSESENIRKEYDEKMLKMEMIFNYYDTLKILFIKDKKLSHLFTYEELGEKIDSLLIKLREEIGELEEKVL